MRTKTANALTLAILALALLEKTGGFSIDANAHKVTAGYAVGNGKQEHVISASQNVADIAEEIYQYIKRNPLEPGEFYGGWKEGGKIYLDKSEQYADKINALHTAKTRNELAIFDLTEKEVIYL